MYRRTLSRDAVLWWQGDAAGTIAVVEKGKLGIRAGGRLLDVACAGTALGEAALLTLDGVPAQRTADVVVLEDDTLVVEYPVASLADSIAGGIPQLVLRTLLGQIGRNHLVVAAAHPAHALVDGLVSGVLETLGRCERQIREIGSWESFLVAFQLLYQMREGSDAMRSQLAARAGWRSETALALLERLRPRLEAPELATTLEQFVRAEADRMALG